MIANFLPLFLLKMQISVIIPTYNGAKKLPNILTALSQQNFKDFETIVVIDGSTDNTVEILEKGKNWGLKDFKYIQRENGGRAKVRNTGAKEAKGNLLIFFDDDMRPEKDCIEKIYLLHQKKENIILVGNAQIDKSKAKNDFDVYRHFLTKKWVQNFVPSPYLLKFPMITAAHASLPKSIFEKLNGFDEQLTDAEDYDMAVRAFELNIPIYFDIENIAWHDDFVSCKKYIHRLRQYRQSHIDLLNLKPALYQKYTQYNPAQLTFTKKIIYGFFGNTFWVNIIDNFNFLKFLPSKLKYKIYDFITTGLGTYFTNRKI
jgi:glycosyltransferase involved in cell wall biosynthesis